MTGELFTVIGSVCLGILFLCFCSLDASAEEVDRLLAAVNGSVITEGDLYVARSLNRLVHPGETAADSTEEETLDRLIDLELIRQEMKNFRIELEDENVIDRRMQELRQQYADSGGLDMHLRKFGLAGEELDSFLRLEISVMKFIDFRFRPFVRVSEEEIAAYYNERLQPQLRAQGLELPPLKEVSGGIRNNLIEEKMNAELDEWIEDARSSADIRYFRDAGFMASDPVEHQETDATE
ncbi:MAG: hypothetical protein P8Z37_11560 [Acidobacteriota bacterium]